MDCDFEVVRTLFSGAVLRGMVSYKDCFGKQRREEFHDIVYDVWEQYSHICNEPEQYPYGVEDMASFILCESGMDDYIKQHAGVIISQPANRSQYA